MTTTDNLLLAIVANTSPTIEELIAPRDSRVLRSLATSVTHPAFITENQAGLILKILRENSKKIKNFHEDIESSVTAPLWSRPFRKIEQVRKVYLYKDEQGESAIKVEFTFSSEIRKIMADLSKSIEGFSQASAGKSCTADLTEKNIVLLVDALMPYNFEIDAIIKSHYTTIKSWSETSFRDQFLITNIEHKNFQKAITEDLGLSTAIDKNIINDRSVRYQYFTEDPKNPGENLVEYIANRNKSKVWVSKSEHALPSVIDSLKQLHRLPMLIVFDTFVNDKYYENLEMLSRALENNGIFDKIGVYFRLPNDAVGKKFNQLIKEKQYNYNLTSDTQVAVVMSGKLPKFFLKTNWTPMSVVALDTKMGLRHGKTSVYSNCCDLVIEWAEKETMFDNRIIG